MDAAFALLFLLPLVGGSLFAKECTFVKYVAAREDGHRLYFRVAYYGIMLFVLSLVLWSLVYGVLHRYEWFRATQQFLAAVLQPLLKDRSQADGQLGFVLVCLTSVPLGRCLPLAVNRLMKQTNEQALWAAVETNELEELLLEAMSYAKSISITLSSNKVYVGLVVGAFEPRTERRAIALQPLMSGYRNDRGKVTFTTFYDTQIAQAPNEADKGEFRLVLPVDKMLSISFFDVETYARFNAVDAPGDAPAPSLDATASGAEGT